MPAIMLKMVVFPAPFGPMRPAIDPRGTNMSTLSTATRPPKRLVRPLMTRMSSAKAESAAAALMRPALPVLRHLVIMLADIEQVLLFLDGDVIRVRLQLGRALLTREESAGPQEHHQHQGETEDDVPILPDVVAGKPVAADLFAEGIERHGQPFGQDAVERSDQHCPDDRAEDVADAAENDRRENQNRQREFELAGMDILKGRGKERAGEPGERGAERERPQLGSGRD